MATIGGLEIFVMSESPAFESQLTKHPIESGSKISDHVDKLPGELRITGQVTGPDAANRLSELKKLRDDAEPVLYVGRNYFQNVVITSLRTEHDNRVANGFRFNMILQQARISRSSFVDLLEPEIKTQVKPVETKGRQQPQEKPASTEAADLVARKFEQYGLGG